ncbi:hypothetical protein HY837_05770 [archaeon]|nr:hypothetical protein [archaeon]
MFLRNRLNKKGSENLNKQIFWFFLQSKKGDAPGWNYLLALALGLIALVFIIWLATKSANVGPSLLP